MVIPPSTLRTWPVIKEASSEAMKTMAFACSSEMPSRAIGTCVTRVALLGQAAENRTAACTSNFRLQARSRKASSSIARALTMDVRPHHVKGNVYVRIGDIVPPAGSCRDD